MLKRIILAVITAISGSSGAIAADIFPTGGAKDVPYFSWTGIYIGIQGGGQWGQSNWFFPGAGTHVDPEFSGAVIGGQIGAQYQFYNNIVAGVEVSGIAGDDTGSKFCPNGVTFCGAAFRNDIEAVGRLGYAWGMFLPYIKGGYANVLFKSSFSAPFVGFTEDHSHSGWVVGGGIDYAFTPHIIFGIDYSHIETDTVRYSGFAGPGFARDVDFSIDRITARVSYKTGPDYTPLK